MDLFGLFRRADPGPSYWDLVEPYWETIDVHDEPQSFLREFDKLPKGSATLLAAHWLFSEVRNGSFVQFFWNGSGVLAPEAHAAFLQLGLADAAQVIERAISTMGSPYPRSCAERRRILDGVWESAPKVAALQDELLQLSSDFYSSLGGWRLRRFKQAADAFAVQHIDRHDPAR